MSQGIKFLYSFSVGELNANNPGSNVISVTSTAAGDHDKKNLTTTPLRETWRSASALTPQEIVIQSNDLTTHPDMFVILNHNFSENAVVTLKASNSLDFTTPALTLSFIYNPKHMIISQDLGAAFNYYKITVSDSGNPCGYVEIGKIVGGRTFTFANEEDMTETFSIKTDDLAYAMKTEGFFRATAETVTVDTFDISFDSIKTNVGSNANYIGLKTMVDFVRTTLPFFTVIDPLDIYFAFVWGQLTTMPTRDYSINRFVTMKLETAEVF